MSVDILTTGSRGLRAMRGSVSPTPTMRAGPGSRCPWHRASQGFGVRLRVFLAALLVGFGPPAPTTRAAPAPEAPDLVDLCTRVLPAFCFIAGGSGVVIRPDGLMLTNDHVLEGKRTFDVRLGDGRSFKARLLGRDAVGDLAALKLELPAGTEVPWLPLGDSEAVRVGDDVLAVGNPFGLGVLDRAASFTTGIISAVHHVQANYTECLVTDAAVNPGNSGGPLLNMAGEVVGINGQISTRYGLRSNTGLGFAIGARQIALWLPRLEQARGGEVRHGRLVGLEFTSVDGDDLGPPVVRDVAEDSPAAAAGFRKGDRIVRIDGLDVPGRRRLAGLLGVYPEGQWVTIDVRRDEDIVPLDVEFVAARPSLVGLELARPRGDDFTPRVATVAADSSAATAGLEAGDEILEFDGRRLEFGSRREWRAFDRALRTGISVGDIVPLVVRREGTGELSLRLVGR
jgi:S1-C subfamily serine protease